MYFKILYILQKHIHAHIVVPGVFQLERPGTLMCITDCPLTLTRPFPSHLSPLPSGSLVLSTQENPVFCCWHFKLSQGQQNAEINGGLTVPEGRGQGGPGLQVPAGLTPD